MSSSGHMSSGSEARSSPLLEVRAVAPDADDDGGPVVPLPDEDGVDLPGVDVAQVRGHAGLEAQGRAVTGLAGLAAAAGLTAVTAHAAVQRDGRAGRRSPPDPK